jgi:hypothetical protein
MPRLLVYLSAIALVGCDSINGVSRHADLRGLPDTTCVETVIRTSPGVDYMRYDVRPGGRPLTWSGIQKPTEVQTFIYTGTSAKIWGALQLEKDYKGRVVLDQNHVEINHLPDPDVIAATRPVMRHIELALAQRCALSELPASVKETCVKVACPSLDDPDEAQK